ncbi:helix-turn-helix domain-containing protein [Streptomyces sp. NBC_00344]|uniref:helix-turn-helix domain-containing protein n=1 Tax=Streptomyces sp. NBC_00344 TaxID=2975720 RepID=UPI002E1FB66B
MSSHEPDPARVIPLCPATRPPGATAPGAEAPVAREPLWRHIAGDVLRRERLAQKRTLQDVADAARISMPYLSELERGLKEASSEVLAAAAHALGLGLADLLALGHAELARLDRDRAAGARKARTPVTSLSELGIRHGGPGAPARRGEVRLAA